MAVIKTQEELDDAINNGESSITIEGDLAKKTFKIHATGKISSIVAIGSIVIAVFSITANLLNGYLRSGINNSFLKVIPINVIDHSLIISLIVIAVVAICIRYFIKVNSYRIIEKSENHLILNK